MLLNFNDLVLEVSKKDDSEVNKLILDLNKEYLELVMRRKSLSEEIELKELEVKVEIMEEVDERGKRVFSNEDKRKLELERRLSEDEEFNMKRAELESVINNIRMVESIREYVRNELAIRLNRSNI